MWTNIDNAHPDRATYVGHGGDEIEVEEDEHAYDEFLVSAQLQVSAGLAPDVNFSGDPVTGPAPLTVQFTNQTRYGGTSEWDFGVLLATSTEDSPSYTYLVPGTYTVQLTVTNDTGDDELTRTGYVVVTA